MFDGKWFGKHPTLFDGKEFRQIVNIACDEISLFAELQIMFDGNVVVEQQDIVRWHLVCSTML